MTQPAAIRQLGLRLAVASSSDTDSSVEALRNIGDEMKPRASRPMEALLAEPSLRVVLDELSLVYGEL
jgi:hypothetical protein